MDAKYAEDAGLVVIDEASMLTEEMLAATLSALGNVQRLVLVGDHRQLPLSGGSAICRSCQSSPSRILRYSGACRAVLCRAHGVRRQGGSSPDDVLLAQWFGDGEVGAGADSVWERLRAGTASQHVEHRQWSHGDIVNSVDELLAEVMDRTTHADPEVAFKLSYGGTLTDDGKYLNWKTGEGGAGDRVEQWQILSPFRSRAFGTVEINRHIKRSLRTRDLADAFKFSRMA